jgi:hypothetical protein
MRGEMAVFTFYDIHFRFAIFKFFIIVAFHFIQDYLQRNWVFRTNMMISENGQVNW